MTSTTTPPSMTNPQTLGARLRERRLVLGLTLEQVAHAAGLSLLTVRSLELGLTKSPHVKTLEAMAHALSTTAPALLSGTIAVTTQAWRLAKLRDSPQGYTCALCHKLYPCLDVRDLDAQTRARDAAEACCLHHPPAKPLREGASLPAELPGSEPASVLGPSDHAAMVRALAEAEALLGWLSVVTLPPARPCAESQPVLPRVLDYLDAQTQLPAEVRDCLRSCYAQRIEMGTAKYGMPLHSHRSRPPRLEALQEALDGMGYEEALVMELEAALAQPELDEQTVYYLLDDLREARQRRDNHLYNVVSGVGSVLRAFGRRAEGLPVPVPEWTEGFDSPAPLVQPQEGSGNPTRGA
jgi:transcriptional regulator with XRE-family HTH domain